MCAPWSCVGVGVASDSDASMRSGVHSSQRGDDIPEFGPDVTAHFCETNDISLVVRSHQCVACPHAQSQPDAHQRLCSRLSRVGTCARATR
jgi:hypothetical protein